MLYPHFLFRGEPYSLPTPASGYSASNVITGSRQLRYKHGSSSTTLTFKTGLLAINGAERQAEYIYLAGLNLVTQRQAVDIEVKGADDSAISVNVTTESVTGVTTSNLIGPRADDYVLPLAGNFKDYWQVKLTCASALTFELRKIFLGQYFDFGVDPDAPLRTDFGMLSTRRYAKVFDITWKGVTNEKLAFFSEKILKHRQYNPIVLYTKSWHGALSGQKAIYAMVDDFKIDRPRHDYNNVTIKFNEMI